MAPLKEKSATTKNLRKVEVKKLKAQAVKNRVYTHQAKPALSIHKTTKSAVKSGTLRALANKLKRLGRRAGKVGKLPVLALPFQAADVHEEVQKRVLRARRQKSEGRYGGET